MDPIVEETVVGPDRVRPRTVEGMHHRRVAYPTTADIAKGGSGEAQRVIPMPARRAEGETKGRPRADEPSEAE